MSHDPRPERDIALVQAALEAAALVCERDFNENYGGDGMYLSRAIRALDPKAIAASVPPQPDEREYDPR